jgi:hypothetical protein
MYGVACHAPVHRPFGNVTISAGIDAAIPGGIFLPVRFSQEEETSRFEF